MAGNTGTMFMLVAPSLCMFSVQSLGSLSNCLLALAEYLMDRYEKGIDLLILCLGEKCEKSQ